MTDLKRAYKLRDNYDNVYAEGKPAHYFPMRTDKLVSIKVQTNVLELLGVDDMIIKEESAEDAEEEYVEELLD